MNNNTEKLVPIYVLSGFLGSGKTTLLTQMVQHCQSQQLTPAVLMNELGEVNLDGQLIKKDVAMSEILGGCICCSMRGDLSLELNQLLTQYEPDVIIAESTGAAHPMETIDAITEVSMYQKIELRSVITIVDGEHMLHRSKERKTPTYRLMQDQIRCASLIILNKTDRLHPEEIVEAQQLIRALNEHAKLVTTSHCQLDDWRWLDGNSSSGIGQVEPSLASANHIGLQEQLETRNDKEALAQHKDEHSQAAKVERQQEHSQHEHSHDHSHVMAYTHYWNNKINSEQFEAWLAKLPKEIYRAKGIVSFRDIPSRYLFQFAFRESDFMKIEPQGEVHDVAVFIGEHFNKEWLQEQLLQLEQD